MLPHISRQIFAPPVKKIVNLFSVQPETVIIPIVCSIIIFPIVVLATICFLKHYNERARAKDRFRYDIPNIFFQVKLVNYKIWLVLGLVNKKKLSFDF